MIETNFIGETVNIIKDYIFLYKYELLMLGLIIGIIYYVITQKQNIEKQLSKTDRW
jgi:hypothetical protein